MAKAFEKQTKTIKDEGKKQVDALKDLKLENQIKSIEVIFPEVREKKMKLKMNCIKLKDMKIKLLEIICFMNGAISYVILKYLKQFNLLVKIIYNNIIEIREANQEQADSLQYINKF